MISITEDEARAVVTLWDTHGKCTDGFRAWDDAKPLADRLATLLTPPEPKVDWVASASTFAGAPAIYMFGEHNLALVFATNTAKQSRCTTYIARRIRHPNGDIDLRDVEEIKP